MGVVGRVGLAAVFAVCLAFGLAACATSKVTGTGTLGRPTTGASATATVATTPTTTPPTTAPTTSAPPAPPAPLRCNQLKSAIVGSSTISYNGYHDGIPLGGLGVWSGEDGNTVTLQPQCGIGDLNGDGAQDAIGVVVLTSGGSGNFYTLVVWRNSSGHPVCTAVTDLGDREPVQSITITTGVATVVYLTRTADAPMAEVNLKRTATFVLSGHSLTETGHVDEPYSG